MGFGDDAGEGRERNSSGRDGEDGREGWSRWEVCGMSPWQVLWDGCGNIYRMNLGGVCGLNLKFYGMKLGKCCGMDLGTFTG